MTGKKQMINVDDGLLPLLKLLISDMAYILAPSPVVELH